MKKPITPEAHGVIDYVTVATVAIAPEILDFPTTAKWLCRTLAADYLAVSLLTDYPLAVKRLIPFKAHGAIEGAIGAVLPALPWALGFARHRAARDFVLGLTGLTAVVAALTDWNGTQGTRTRRVRNSERARALSAGAPIAA